MIAKRKVIRAKPEKEIKLDEDDELCFFVITNDIEPDEVAECEIKVPNGTITTLYCRKEHEYSIRSVMRQLHLSKNDKIEITKLRTISRSWSLSQPYLGLTNLA